MQFWCWSSTLYHFLSVGKEKQSPKANLLDFPLVQALYPPQVLEPLVQRIASTDLMGLGQRWRLPKEVGPSHHF